LREPVGKRLAVESQPAAWAAQADAAELGGMLVDPIALDAEEPRDVGGVDKPLGRSAVLSRRDQLDHAAGDLLDVIGVENHLLGKRYGIEIVVCFLVDVMWPIRALFGSS
jgi:hypothetical protein